MGWFEALLKVTIVQLVLGFIVDCIAQDHEYLYPVGALHDSKRSGVLVLYQKSVHHTELWLWHPETTKATKLLLSTFNPAGVTILPDNSGFAFIDNNKVRIKYFHKRSPMMLDFDQPIYDLTIIHWNDSNSFYFSAKEHRRFRIYHADIKAGCFCIIGFDDYEAMYPQRIENDLFFVRRSELDMENVQYTIEQTQYPQECDIFLRKRIYDPKLAYEIKQPCLLLHSDKPISFLHMISSYEGFFLEHPSTIEPHTPIIPFSYYHLKKIDDQHWHSQKIFEFSIPSSMLINSSDQRLFESILPLLPQYAGKGFYFTTLDAILNGLVIKFYNLETGIIESIFEDAGNYMSPIIYKSKLLCGGPLQYQRLPIMHLDHRGIICFDLPQKDLKDL